MTHHDPAALGALGTVSRRTADPLRDVAGSLVRSDVRALCEVCDVSPARALSMVIRAATAELCRTDRVLGHLVAGYAVDHAAALGDQHPLLLEEAIAQIEGAAPLPPEGRRTCG